MAADLNLLGYAGVIVLAAMTPGPDFVIVTRHAAVGRRQGLAAAAGIASGVGVNTAAALLGLAAIFLAFPSLYDLVLWLAAGYLIFLGAGALIGVWKARRQPAAPPPDPDGGPAVSGPGGRAAAGTVAGTVAAAAPARPVTAWTAYRQALLTNCLNPKVIIFLVTLAPQFMPKTPTLADKVAIEVASIVSVMVWFTVVTLLVSLFSAWLQRPRVALSIGAVMGVVLLGIGLRIAISLL